jgi:hypothetical protein
MWARGGVRRGSPMRLKQSGSWRGLVIAALLCLVLGACLPSQWEYLIEAADRATQDEVRKRMGPPSLTKDMPDGDSVWAYRYEVRSSLVGRRGDMVGGSPCMEYVLTFDAQEILRHWVRRPC